MTTVLFSTSGPRISGFSVRGHSGFGEEGADLVCAAVTSAVRVVEATVNDVLGLAAAVRVSPEEPSIVFTLPGGLSPEVEETCQTLLTGLMVYFTQLHDEYPAYLEVREAETRAAHSGAHRKKP